MVKYFDLLSKTMLPEEKSTYFFGYEIKPEEEVKHPPAMIAHSKEGRIFFTLFKCRGTLNEAVKKLGKHNEVQETAGEPSLIILREQEDPRRWNKEKGPHPVEVVLEQEIQKTRTKITRLGRSQFREHVASKIA